MINLFTEGRNVLYHNKGVSDLVTNINYLRIHIKSIQNRGFPLTGTDVSYTHTYM